MFCCLSSMSILLTCSADVAEVPTVAASETESSTLFTLGFGLYGCLGFRQNFAKWLTIPQFLHFFPRAGHFCLCEADYP